jgi:hypothetical protein
VKSLEGVGGVNEPLNAEPLGKATVTEVGGTVA